MKKWTFLLTLAFLALVVLGVMVTAQEEGNSVASPLAQPRVRIAHLAPFAADPDTAVTVAVNGVPLTGAEFGDSTNYVPIPPDTYLIEVYLPGNPTPVISSTVILTNDVDYTMIAVGGANGWPLDLELLEDDNTPPASGKAKVLIGHLAPFAAGAANTLADVRLQDGTVILDDVPYGAIAGYLELDAGDYDLKITTPDGAATLIDPLPVTLSDGDILSAFAVGDGANQPLGVFAWPSDQVGFLLPLKFYNLFMPIVMRNAP